jgi:hypothetical protein
MITLNHDTEKQSAAVKDAFKFTKSIQLMHNIPFSPEGRKAGHLLMAGESSLILNFSERFAL